MGGKEWTEEEIIQLNHIVGPYFEENKMYLIDWNDISKKMCKKNRNDCYNKWFNYIRASRSLKYSIEVIDLIGAFKKQGLSWMEITNKLDLKKGDAKVCYYRYLRQSQNKQEQDKTWLEEKTALVKENMQLKEMLTSTRLKLISLQIEMSIRDSSNIEKELNIL